MGGRLIAITSQKGGVGKTTLATNMACVAARELQHDVALMLQEVPACEVPGQRLVDRGGPAFFDQPAARIR